MPTFICATVCGIVAIALLLCSVTPAPPISQYRHEEIALPTSPHIPERRPECDRRRSCGGTCVSTSAGL